MKLDETGADGLVPIRDIGDEYFHFDHDSQTLRGADTGQIIRLGLRVSVKIAEAAPVTGGLILELLEIEGKQIAARRGERGGRGRPRGKPSGPPKGRKPAAAKRKAAKTARKVKRTRK